MSDAQDVLRYVLSCLQRASENAHPWSLTPNEAGVLVAEVERLRDQVEVRIQHGHNLRTMLESATETERAAAVKHLLGGTADCVECLDEAVVRLAREIERGEHRREEEP